MNTAEKQRFAMAVRARWLELCHASVAVSASRAAEARSAADDYWGDDPEREDALRRRAETMEHAASDERARVAAAFGDVPLDCRVSDAARRLVEVYDALRIPLVPGVSRGLARRFDSLASDAARWERTGEPSARGAFSRPRRGCFRRVLTIILWFIVANIVGTLIIGVIAGILASREPSAAPSTPSAEPPAESAPAD